MFKHSLVNPAGNALNAKRQREIMTGVTVVASLETRLVWYRSVQNIQVKSLNERQI